MPSTSFATSSVLRHCQRQPTGIQPHTSNRCPHCSQAAQRGSTLALPIRADTFAALVHWISSSGSPGFIASTSPMPHKSRRMFSRGIHDSTVCRSSHRVAAASMSGRSDYSHTLLLHPIPLGFVVLGFFGIEKCLGTGHNFG